MAHRSIRAHMRPHATQVYQQRTTHQLNVVMCNINLMFRTNVRDPPVSEVYDEVFYWRDGYGWLVPATIQEVDAHGDKLLHNGRIKTSSMNRLRCLRISSTPSPAVSDAIPLHPTVSDYEDDVYEPDAVTV